jgi:dipeptidyl aminopeptidase/acylaminoacyl peptidase
MSAAQSVSPSIDEMLELPQIGDTEISPDGRFVVYELIAPDWKQNRYVSQLWLAAVDGSEPPRRLTFARQGSGHPRWSPDGHWILFLSRRAGDRATQLYRLSPVGGEAERLTDFESGIETFHWSPDGRRVAYVALEASDETERERQRRYGSYVVENEDYRHAHLWVYDLEAEKRRQLTRGKEIHVRDFSWCPDSRRLAFSAASDPDMARYHESRVFVVDVEARHLEDITPPGFSSPCWSPDGKSLACLRFGETYYATNELWVIDADGSDARPVPVQLDENKNLVIWTTAGIYFSATARTSIHLYVVDDATGVVTQVTPEQAEGLQTGGFSFDERLATAACSASSGTRSGEVAIVDVHARSLQLVTDYQAALADQELVSPEVVCWKSTDGTEIEGLLYKPHNLDPQKRHPLLVVIHGGPAGTALQQLTPHLARRYYPVQQWVQKGALVLMPNYRGSAGYGTAFRGLNVRNLGLGDYEDVVSGVDKLVADGLADPERIGAMGWSQGGYISAFITTYSDRFRAVSVGAGISNWITYYVNTDVHPFTRHYLQATPWEEKEIYERTSPMTYINRAATPTLIQHGERDQRVPLPNARELYQGLLDVGVEARLVTFPGMAHSISRPRENRRVVEENWAWFNRHVFGEPDAAARSEVLYVTLPDADKLRHVSALAVHDRVDCRVLTGRWGLAAPDERVLADDRDGLDLDAAAKLQTQIREQLEEGGWRTVFLYNGSPDMTSQHLGYVGSLLVAGGTLGVYVEHADVDPDGD